MSQQNIVNIIYIQFTPKNYFTFVIKIKKDIRDYFLVEGIRRLHINNQNIFNYHFDNELDRMLKLERLHNYF